MHDTIPLSLSALVAVGIIVIGCLYVLSPQRVLGGFGLKPPAPDPDTYAWLRLKGIRDVASGLAVLTLMLTSDAGRWASFSWRSPSFLLETCRMFWLPGGARSRRSPFMA